jgi:hypothetical protein
MAEDLRRLICINAAWGCAWGKGFYKYVLHRGLTERAENERNRRQDKRCREFTRKMVTYGRIKQQFVRAIRFATQIEGVFARERADANQVFPCGDFNEWSPRPTAGNVDQTRFGRDASDRRAACLILISFVHVCIPLLRSFKVGRHLLLRRRPFLVPPQPTRPWLHRFRLASG